MLCKFAHSPSYHFFFLLTPHIYICLCIYIGFASGGAYFALVHITCSFSNNSPFIVYIFIFIFIFSIGTTLSHPFWHYHCLFKYSCARSEKLHMWIHEQMKKGFQLVLNDLLIYEYERRLCVFNE